MGWLVKEETQKAPSTGRYMTQQLASSVCCSRLSWKLRRSRVDVLASMRKRSRDSKGIWLAT